MEQPIRVLQLFTILNRGGAETNIMNYYRKIDRTKIQFDFVVHRPETGVFEEEIIQLGGKIFRFQPFNPLKIISYKKQISHFFDDNKYQIIHGNCSELGIYIYKEAKKRNVPVIIAHAHNTTFGFDFKVPFKLFYKNRMMNYINTYFSCGQDAATWLFGKKNVQKTYIMKNAVDSSFFSFDNQINTAYRKLLKSENTINLICVGNFSKIKNHNFLIDIFAQINILNPNFKLFLVGNGTLKSKIEDKVNKLHLQDKILFLGTRNDVNNLLQASDFFIMTSFFEGLPVSLIEAQSSGIKSFISTGIPKEAILISENVTQISLKKSPKFWAEKIINSIGYSRQNVALQIKNAGYDIATNVKNLENKYLELLAQNS